MNKSIYLIRHGETEYNKKQMVQGSGIDADLNDTGRQQADAFFEAYQHIPFDKIYVSALKRSYQSVERFVKEKNIAYEALSALNEISWGSREGSPFDPQEHQYYLDTLAAWQQGHTHLAIEGGESPEEVARRQRPFIDLLRSRPEEQKVLVCMHGRAMRILLSQLLSYPLALMDTFPHHNLGLYELYFSGTMFQIVRFNDRAHLLQADLKQG